MVATWTARVGALALGGMIACTPVDPPAPAPSEPAPPECADTTPPAPLPVVTILQTRDHEVTVHAAPDGLRFTVSLAGGALLGHQLTAREFARSFPGLQQRYDSAFAGDETWLDARIDTAVGAGAGDPLMGH